MGEEGGTKWSREGGKAISEGTTGERFQNFSMIHILLKMVMLGGVQPRFHSEAHLFPTSVRVYFFDGQF
jgi:hypothetical protein